MFYMDILIVQVGIEHMTKELYVENLKELQGRLSTKQILQEQNDIQEKRLKAAFAMSLRKAERDRLEKEREKALENDITKLENQMKEIDKQEKKDLEKDILKAKQKARAAPKIPKVIRAQKITLDRVDLEKLLECAKTGCDKDGNPLNPEKKAAAVENKATKEAIKEMENEINAEAKKAAF